MPAPGSVWASGSWDVNAWAANTWANAGGSTTPVQMVTLQAIGNGGSAANP